MTASLVRKTVARKKTSFAMTLRDREIIAAVSTHRALTTDQVSLLFWDRPKANNRCRHRLKVLSEHGFLERAEQPIALTDGRKPLVYFLDSKGLGVASEVLDVSPAKIDWNPKHNNVKWPFLEHLLATNEIRVRMEVAAPKAGFTIQEWIDDKSLASRSIRDRITIADPDGGTRQMTVGPDGYVSLLSPDGKTKHRAFIEADRATVPLARWRTKVWKYLQYFRSREFRDRYEATKPFRVLTVTTSQERLENMKKETESLGAITWFWFSTYDAIREGDRILFQPVWSMAGHGKHVSFPFPEPTPPRALSTAYSASRGNTKARRSATGSQTAERGIQ
jgi:hypothetical protein